MIGYLILAIHCLILLLLIILLIMTINYPYKTINELEAELNRHENRVKEIEERE